MFSRNSTVRRSASWWAIAAVVSMVAFAGVVQSWAGFVEAPAVGGISIDGMGVLSTPRVQDQEQLLRARETALEEINDNLAQYTKMRMISLKQLDEAVRTHRAGQPFPLSQEIQFLAGLQRIEYVFVYPERNDIVIAGPAEAWKIDELGNVVGVTTGHPVLALDDLMVALRGAEATNGAGVYCSIDPTADGLKRVNEYFDRLTRMGNPNQTMREIEQVLGPQVVTVGGVPETTHFARVLVAADFRMKRIAMGFDPSPVDGLPSYMKMATAASASSQNAMPRWWLQAKYEPITTDGDGLAWKLQPSTVECLTEQDIVKEDGTREATGRTNRQAKRWASLMTEKYPELAEADSTFGQLRSVMDLAVVAALIKKEGLLDFAGLQLPTLMEKEQVKYFNAPKEVATEANFIKKGSNWIITASGGVKFHPWTMAENLAEDQAVLADRDKAVAKTGANWWWN